MYLNNKEVGFANNLLLLFFYCVLEFFCFRVGPLERNTRQRESWKPSMTSLKTINLLCIWKHNSFEAKDAIKKIPAQSRTNFPHFPLLHIMRCLIIYRAPPPPKTSRLTFALWKPNYGSNFLVYFFLFWIFPFGDHDFNLIWHKIYYKKKILIC